MTAPTTTLSENIVWYTNTPILFLCAFFMWRRKSVTTFPYFFLYLLFVGTKSYALIPIFNEWGYSSPQFFYSSLGSDFVSMSLTFVIFYEVMRNVLTSGTLKVSRANFIVLTAVLLTLGALLSTMIKAQDDLPYFRAIIMVKNALRVDQIALLLVLALATVFFGFYWKDLAFGIAAGFGEYASMTLLSLYLRAKLGIGGTHISNVVDTWSYEVASFIWLFYILRKPRTVNPDPLPREELSKFEDPLERMKR